MLSWFPNFPNRLFELLFHKFWKEDFQKNPKFKCCIKPKKTINLLHIGHAFNLNLFQTISDFKLHYKTGKLFAPGNFNMPEKNNFVKAELEFWWSNYFLFQSHQWQTINWRQREFMTPVSYLPIYTRFSLPPYKTTLSDRIWGTGQTTMCLKILPNKDRT